MKFEHVLSKTEVMITSNKQIVQEIVSRDGMYLRYVSRELRSDESIVYYAIRNCGHAFAFADESLRVNPIFAITAINLSIDVIPHMSIELLNKIAVEAIAKCDTAVYYALPDIIKARKDVVLAGIEYEHVLLRDMPEYVRYDKEIILASLQKNIPSNIKYVMLPITSEFILEALEVVPDPFRLFCSIDPMLYENKDFVLKIASKYRGVIKYAPKYSNDPDVLTVAIRALR